MKMFRGRAPRVPKIFHPVFWRSVAEAFRDGADQTKNPR